MIDLHFADARYKVIDWPMSSLAAYEQIKVIGRGSFGRAVLVRRLSDSQLLVIKQVLDRAVATQSILIFFNNHINNNFDHFFVSTL